VSESQQTHDHSGEKSEVVKVGPLELFFDLVFVFALTQVTGLLAEDLTWAGLLRGLAVLTVVWWSWVGFSWLTSYASAEETGVRLAMMGAMAAMLVVSLAVPQAFGEWGVQFGAAYLAVMVMFLATYAAVGRGDPHLFGALVRLAPGILIASVLLLAAGFLDAGPARFALWALAIVISLAAPLLSGTSGWRVSPGHFAERHALIVIIALGESIVSIGIGAAGLPLDAREITAATLGLVLACCLWWLYFDVVAPAAERRLHAAAPGAERNALARDSFSYLHLPMVGGIVLFALGAKKVLAAPDDSLKQIALVALCGGLAMYLLAHVAFRWRNIGSVNIQRTVVAAVLLAAIPLLAGLPALAVLTMVALLMVALVAYEAIRFREMRHQIRFHGAAGPPAPR
jgi:low temperature requirement protein LtrA